MNEHKTSSVETVDLQPNELNQLKVTNKLEKNQNHLDQLLRSCVDVDEEVTTRPNNGIITRKLLEKCKHGFDDDPQRQVLKHAIIKNGINNVSINHDAVVNMRYSFSEEIKTGKITSQEKSGSCWLFAGLNLFRQKIAREYKIKDFELSENYLLFWDKLEKANYFLENIIETVQADINSRIVMWLLRNPVQDGGQWDMFSNLIKKYGVVPKSVMLDTFHSSNTPVMDQLLTLKLREDAKCLRNLYREGKDRQSLRARKKEMVYEIYRMLVNFLGQPPSTFVFEYRDDDDKYHRDQNLTPHSFFEKYVNIDVNDFVSIINAPTFDKPLNKTFTVKYLGNVVGGDSVKYLNVDIETMKQLVLAQLNDHIPVWFGCDVLKMMHSETGIMDSDIYLYEDTLGISFNLDKAGRLEYGESQLTHAMVFTGVNLVEGKPNRWKVENSWGEKVGNKGFFIMSDRWFEEFNYQIVVHKRYLSDELKETLKKKSIVLPPWDPMGSLAIMK